MIACVYEQQTAGCQGTYDAWQQRDLTARRCAYIRADGVYFQARTGARPECMLVIIRCRQAIAKQSADRGRNAGRKEGTSQLSGRHAREHAEPPLGVCAQTPAGQRDASCSSTFRRAAWPWRRKLPWAPLIDCCAINSRAVDRALGFWKALDQIWPGTRHQRCWIHKIGNLLNAFPSFMAPAVKSDLYDIPHAETRADALAATDAFEEKYATKYPKAVTGLSKDRDALMAFYDVPAEHRDHLRSSNPPSRACVHRLPGTTWSDETLPRRSPPHRPCRSSGASRMA